MSCPYHPLIRLWKRFESSPRSRKETNGSSSQFSGYGPLPVRIWGVDAHDLPFMQLASVKNLSSTGAVVQGVRRQIKPGEILEVQSDEEKARFRVIWTGMQGTESAGEIGLQRLASEPYLWGVALGCYSELVAEG